MKNLKLIDIFTKKTNNLFKKNVFLIVFICFSSSINAQLIFSEPFDEIDNSTTGFDNTGGVNWFTSCPSCLDPGDFFKVVAGELVGQDSNGPATWETGIINTNSCDFFNITLVLKEIGTLEGCGTGCTSVDWVQLEYNIDNSGWQTPTNSMFCNGGCAGINVIQADDINGASLNYNTGCITGGSTLQLRITVQAWAASEQWILDDINVSCATGPTLDAGLDQSICGGDITLTAYNPNNGNIIWNNGVVDGVTFTPPNGLNTYVVSSDLYGCIATDTVLITVNAPPTFNVNSNNPTTCNGNDGNIIFSGLDASLAYQLTYVNNGITVGPISQNSSLTGTITVPNLTAGVYSNFIISLSGCSTTNTSTLTLSDPSAPIISAGPDQIACENTQIILTAVNPSNAVISWDQNITNGAPFTILAGTTDYTVTATLNGCISSDVVSVTSTQAPTINAGADQVICEGTMLNLSAINPDNASITWSNGIADGIDFTPLSGQNYFVVSGNLNGCVVTDTVIIDVTPLPNFTITQQNPSICSGNDGALLISGLLPNTTYDYSYQSNSLQGPFSVNSNASGDIVISNLIAGNYSNFEVTFLGCSNQINTVFTLSDPNLPQLDAGADQTICLGDEVVLTAYNPDNANLLWSNNIIDGVPFTILTDQTYLVTAELNSCTNVDTIHINVLPAPTIEAGQNQTVCRGDSVLLAAVSSNTNFNWDNGVVDGVYFQPQITTTYTVTTNIGTCTVRDTLIIFVNQGPDASFTFTPNQPTVQNTEVTFQPLYTNDLLHTFNWEFGDHFTSTLSQPTHFYPSVGGMSYQIKLVVTDTAGCRDTSSTFITVDDILIYYVPNAFTPSSDAINQTFQPVFTSGFDVYDYHLTIFNRWGEIMFESYNPNIGWNGTYIGGNNTQEGVYVWTIEFGDYKTDKRTFVTGQVTLLR